jgi:hypothetical protein
MYSAKAQKPKELEVMKLLVNDKEFDLNSAGFSKVYMEYQLSNGKKSEKFGLWLKKYLEQHSNIKVDNAILQLEIYDSEKPYKLIRTDEYAIYQH